MKNPKTGENTHGDQVYVLTTNNVTDRERLRDFLEQHGYNFFTASEGSELFRQIQDAMVVSQVSSPQNDSAYGLREKSLPRSEEIASSGMLLSREQLHGNYDDIIGESAVHLEVLKSIDRFAKSYKITQVATNKG